MKEMYEVDTEEVQRNILLEVSRYISNTEGYPRKLFEHNIKQILELGFKKIPTDYKKE